MHLLLINPNTTASITKRMEELARALVPTGTQVTAVTGRFGARYVASRATYAIAGHAALDAYAEHGATADAVVLACFGDPALLALKELAYQPVVGMAEASCLRAAALGGRFAIVTGGERWGPMLREFVAGIGLADRLASVATVAPTGAAIAADPESALDLLAEACRLCAVRDGADSVILAGAGLAGLTARIRDRVPVPLIDSLEASVRLAVELAAVRPGKAHVGSFAPTPHVESVGLATPLSRLLGG
jgi:Asp/Glu/hydantoin racemase